MHSTMSMLWHPHLLPLLAMLEDISHISVRLRLRANGNERGAELQLRRPESVGILRTARAVPDGDAPYGLKTTPQMATELGTSHKCLLPLPEIFFM